MIQTIIQKHGIMHQDSLQHVMNKIISVQKAITLTRTHAMLHNVGLNAMRHMTARTNVLVIFIIIAEYANLDAPAHTQLKTATCKMEIMIQEMNSGLT